MRHVTYRAVAGCCAMLATLASTRIAPAQSMSDNEAKATRLSSQWRDGAGLVTKGADGKVIFLYGQSQPFVVCSPLQVCDIELEAGEVGRDARRGRVAASDLVQVGPVDAGGRDPHQQLARARLGRRQIGQLQDLGSAVLGVGDRSHRRALPGPGRPTPPRAVPRWSGSRTPRSRPPPRPAPAAWLRG